jgi:hypothetical protein
VNRTAQMRGVIAGGLASLFCFAAGVWILTKVGLTRGEDALSTAIGLYFIGKGFFVGPMLVLTALSSGERRPAP